MAVLRAKEVEMRWRMAIWIGAVGVLLGPACYSSGGGGDDDATDDGRDTAHDVGPDAARPEDADLDDGGRDDGTVVDADPDATCLTPQYWQRTMLEVDRFEDGSDGSVTAGQTARVWAWVNVLPPGCGDLGRVLVDVDAASYVVRVRVEGWTNADALAGPCPSGTPTMVLAALPSLAAGTWTILDGSVGPAGDPASMTLEIAPCDADCGCLGPTTPGDEGADCGWDCECRADLGCIGYYTIAGITQRACYRTCNSDRDCPWDQRCASWDDGPTAVCMTMGVGTCADASDCAPGWDCMCPGTTGCVCMPAMPLTGGTCCRDEDCAAGQGCVEYYGEAGSPLHECLVRCTSDFACNGGYCGAAPDGPAGVCYPGE